MHGLWAGLCLAISVLVTAQYLVLARVDWTAAATGARAKALQRRRSREGHCKEAPAGPGAAAPSNTPGGPSEAEGPAVELDSSPVEAEGPTVGLRAADSAALVRGGAA